MPKSEGVSHLGQSVDTLAASRPADTLISEPIAITMTAPPSLKPSVL